MIFDYQQSRLYQVEQFLATRAAPFMTPTDERAVVARVSEMYSITAPAIVPWDALIDSLPLETLCSFLNAMPSALYMDHKMLISFNHARLRDCGMTPVPLFVSTHEIAHAVCFAITREFGMPTLRQIDFVPWRSPHGPMFASVHANILAELTGLCPRKIGAQYARFGIDLFDPAEFAPACARDTAARYYARELEANRS